VLLVVAAVSPRPEARARLRTERAKAMSAPGSLPPGAYAVVTEDGPMATPLRGGLSHAEAMTLAETLRGEGRVVRVMHVTGGNSYEVDRYPVR
jgi:hypothetical protein